MSATSIAPDSFVTISYAIFEDGADVPTPGAEKLTESYVHGYGQVLPALENGLAGKALGSKVVLHADPEDAFGAHESEGVFELDKDGLDGADQLQPGEEVVASGPQGDLLMRVIEVRPGSLLVDTNHPLAGKRVRFEVEVIELRSATEEEIEEAQAELDSDECGCGHDHGADHDHPHGEGHGHSHEPLVKLDPRRGKPS